MAESGTELLERLTGVAEDAWLERWTSGPTEGEGTPQRTGSSAPDLVLADETGQQRALSEFWDGQPALLMFWRPFGCGCGLARAERLRAEWRDHRPAGPHPALLRQRWAAP